MIKNKSAKNFTPIVLTGDRPTGNLHLGHYVGSITNRLKLQNDFDTCFYMVADVQALTDNMGNPQKVRDNVKEVIIDNMSCGLDPEKTTIFIQSMVPEIAELTIFFMNLVTLQQLSHNPTIKTEAAEKGFTMETRILSSEEYPDHLNEGEEETIRSSENNNEVFLKHEKNTTGLLMKAVSGIPIGFLAYPISQAADILFAKANIVPVGEDQLPVIEQANDIVKKFNTIYKKEIFPKIKPLVSSNSRLVGMDGNSKASKSLNNAIFLTDDSQTLKKKIQKMFTCPSKVHITDTVSLEELENNVVFNYLDIFDTDMESLKDIKDKYKEGHPDFGDSYIKNRLFDILDAKLETIRNRRRDIIKKIEDDPVYLDNIIQKGVEKAREHARVTLKEVKEVLKIDYFQK